MFQFTTTTVINSNSDYTTGKPLWTLQAEKDGRPASLNIKRVHHFLKPYVTAIYKAEGHKDRKAYATMDFSKIPGKKGDLFRVYLYIGLTQASQNSRYANDLVYKGKPFSIDFIVEDTAAETVKKLVKTIKKYELLVYGEKLLNVASTGNLFFVRCLDEHQRIVKFNVDYFDKDANHGMGEYVTRRSLEDLPYKKNGEDHGNAWPEEQYFPGLEGFGTYSYLLHNLRIPTDMNTRPFGVYKDEVPIPGALYNQYTLYYCKNRGILGDNAVGDLVQSQTTHVFYVNQSVADEFETALTQVGTIINVDGPHTPDPDTVKAELASLVKVVDAHTKQIAIKADKATVDSDFLKKTEAATTYVKTADAESKYAKTADVQSTYETKEEAKTLAAEYTKTTELASTYLKQQDLRNHLEDLKNAIKEEP